MKKFIGPGLIAGVAMLVTGMAVSRFMAFFFPSINVEFVNPAMYRPWNDPLMSLYFLYPFVLGLTLAWVWDKTKDLFKGKDALWRGKRFGLAYWVAAGIPGMLITYSSFQVSFTMILSWSLSGLFQAIVAGWIFAKMNA